jgi:hypothetical protein
MTCVRKPRCRDPRLPAEILDHVVDHLHDTKMRSGIAASSLNRGSRAPEGTFSPRVGFPTAEILHIMDERHSQILRRRPACYVKNLSVTYPQLFTDPDAEAGNWIRWFSCVVHLESGQEWIIDRPITLSRPIPRILACHQIPPPDLRHPPARDPQPHSFISTSRGPGCDRVHYEPLSDSDDDPHWLPATAQPSSPPRFTGSLEVYLKGGKNSFARRLLSLPGGIHFRKLALTWLEEEDPSLMTALIEKCSHTLESLDIFHSLLGTSILPRCLHP